MKIIEINSKDLECNTKKDFKKLLKEKYDAARDKDLQVEILGVTNEKVISRK